MDGMSLEAAKDWLRARLGVGAYCPLCTQYAKVYRRKINSGMALSLIAMYRAAGRDWQDITKTVGAKHREEGKLRYWELVEPGERRGVWRVTPLGEAFVLGRWRVLSHANIYDDRLMELTGTPIGIREALGNRFDYDELMTTPGLRSSGAIG
jgi:hypothetical protein